MKQNTICSYEYEATYSCEFSLNLNPTPIINNSYKKSKKDKSWLRKIKAIR